MQQVLQILLAMTGGATLAFGLSTLADRILFGRYDVAIAWSTLSIGLLSIGTAFVLVLLVHRSQP